MFGGEVKVVRSNRFSAFFHCMVVVYDKQVSRNGQLVSFIKRVIEFKFTMRQLPDIEVAKLHAFIVIVYLPSHKKPIS